MTGEKTTCDLPTWAADVLDSEEGAGKPTTPFEPDDTGILDAIVEKKRLWLYCKFRIATLELNRIEAELTGPPEERGWEARKLEGRIQELERLKHILEQGGRNGIKDEGRKHYDTFHRKAEAIGDMEITPAASTGDQRDEPPDDEATYAEDWSDLGGALLFLDD